MGQKEPPSQLLCSCVSSSVTSASRQLKQDSPWNPGWQQYGHLNLFAVIECPQQLAHLEEAEWIHEYADEEDEEEDGSIFQVQAMEEEEEDEADEAT